MVETFDLIIHNGTYVTPPGRAKINVSLRDSKIVEIGDRDPSSAKIHSAPRACTFCRTLSTPRCISANPTQNIRKIWRMAQRPPSSECPTPTP